MSYQLPPADHYQYFSHLFHAEKMIPYDQYQPMSDWDYPSLDRTRFERLFLTDISYIKDCRILDLGCHTGYLSYIAKTLGATSIYGVNARQHPLDVANFAYAQLMQSNYIFEQGNIEDLEFLEKICKDKDTLIFTQVLEHLRNPYAIIETISNSDIKNLIFESLIFSDEGEPGIKYYLQTTESPFAVYEGGRKNAIGSCPNLAWLEMILYFFNWRIEFHEVERQFNRNWFADPNLTKFLPQSYKSVTMLCKKFETTALNKTFEY